ncbi:response regulator transcription factor [Streptosporangium roseum]|uniref:Response regulator receiver protein n=1 Tax=Streptosporangium roseum (strain ATCC 12428 / DSM 43021 / JCM 3005 / KCTC 9067 / NCIMB 10171 / NRRL 2505 / NI 9100) TaxID=479432 RepID=D2B0A5_STRRD|nr:response regulator transcription factor [Streptosporangium roseum]ACZ89111.1 response regulator receiver protein [Streptosporangium roseum DSM 43021]
MGDDEAARVLVVDDEPALREALQSSLEYEGYRVGLASDGLAALEILEREPYELVLLDVMMPRLDGLTACRRLRAAGNHVPVLMLTARDAVGDRVSGLDAGADDYLVKPFELDELLARVRALLRRSALTAPAAADDDGGVLLHGDLRMDTASREVTRAGEPLELTRTEYLLLELLMVHPRQVLTREQILSEVWGFDFEPSSNSLDVYVMYLRRKTEAAGRSRLIHTVRGVGYVLRSSP